MIEREDRDGVAILRLAHGKANTIDLELIVALRAALDDVVDSDAKAVVLTGAGRMFSAGVDLKRLAEGGAGYVGEFLPALHRALVRLFTLPRPVVAAVNGHAIAGGCVIACAADRRLMAEGSGRIGVPELVVGVPLPTVVSEILRAVVTPPRLTEVIYGGATYDAADALAIGFVDQLCPAASLVDEAVAVAARLGAIPAASFGLTKRSLRAPALTALVQAADLEQEIHAAWRSDPVLQAVRTYVEATLKRT